MDDSQLARLALFIDAENLVISTQKLGLPLNIKAVVDRAREEGTLSFAKAYADWTQHPMLGYVSHFHESVIELALLSSVYGKNTADIQIVVDAMEMALSIGTPEVFMLVAGDRDFVPVVQKLKRYGKRVVGVGLQETTSAALRAVCDAFLFYENLIQHLGEEKPSAAPDKTEEQEPVPAELQEAFSLLLRAVITLERKGETPMGANIRPLMQQLDPAFDLIRYPYVKFTDFVEAAVQSGYCTFGPERGEHFTLKSPPTPVRLLSGQPLALVSKSSFEDPGDALSAYREIQAQKRVPMIPWRDRQILIKHLWDCLREREGGMTWEQMHAALIDGAARNFMNLPPSVLFKQLMTLSMGGCFEPGGPAQQFDRFSQEPAKARCGYEEALLRVNAAYVRGIKHHSPEIPLLRRPLSLLLFERDGDDELVQIEEIIRRASYVK